MASENPDISKEIPGEFLEVQSKPIFEFASEPCSPTNPTMLGDIAANSNQGLYIKEAKTDPDGADDALNIDRYT